jgi:molybdopterin-guanine dinucleotide biosynthesis protein A
MAPERRGLSAANLGESMNQAQSGHSVAILAGGASSRMGFDKSMARFGPQNLLERMVEVAELTGPTHIYVCGGPVDSCAHLRVDHLADRMDQQGPVAGLLTAIETDLGDRLSCVAVDLPSIQASTILQVITDFGDADVLVPVSDGRRQWHLSGWRSAACREPVRAAFELGARSFEAATASLDVKELIPINPDQLADVDTPDDLQRAGGRPPRRRDLS